jgi:hypothetical protein
LSFDGCAYRPTRPRPSFIGGASTDPFLPASFFRAICWKLVNDALLA